MDGLAAAIARHSSDWAESQHPTLDELDNAELGRARLTVRCERCWSCVAIVDRDFTIVTYTQRLFRSQADQGPAKEEKRILASCMRCREKDYYIGTDGRRLSYANREIDALAVWRIATAGRVRKIKLSDVVASVYRPVTR